jgi:N utilization substance protein A
VRHYFGQYEEGEERPAEAEVKLDAAASEDHAVVETAEEPAVGGSEESSEEKTPEEILETEAGSTGEVAEVHDVSSEAIANAEDKESESDAVSDADAREETIELENDAVDSLVNESQEVSDEGVETDGQKRG